MFPKVAITKIDLCLWSFSEKNHNIFLPTNEWPMVPTDILNEKKIFFSKSLAFLTYQAG